MGNENPSSKPSNLKSPYFTSVETIHTSKQDILRCKTSVSHFRIREQWSSIVNELRNIPHEHIMVPKNWRVIEKSVCGSGEIVEIDYDGYDSNLAELIEQRATGGKYFEQSQLWYVLYALTQVAVNCRSLGYRVGDIRPENILMNKQGQIKMLTHLSFPNDLNPFTQQTSKAFFSPEQLEYRKKGCMQNVTDPIQNESYSIGLTLLSMALLQNMNQIYNRQEQQINRKQLEKGLDKMKEINYFNTKTKAATKYSEGFCHGLILLLQTEYKKRLGYCDLFNQLSPFLRQLQDFIPFQIHLMVNEDPVIRPSASKLRNKEVITLRSRHKKQSPRKPLKEEKPDYIKVSSQYLPLGQATIIESRFVNRPPSYAPFHELSTTGNNNQLLRQIDEKLRRSRQQFPS